MDDAVICALFALVRPYLSSLVEGIEGVRRQVDVDMVWFIVQDVMMYLRLRSQLIVLMMQAL